jgi:predicted ribosomally synthesized peptide with SipW-like signal peptide
MRKLTISFINLMIIVLLFTAATFAWFNDTVINQDNRIQVGNLKVSLVASDSLTFDEPLYNLENVNLQDLKIDTSAVFDFEGRVEPGQSLTRYIRVKNVGTIAMDYEVHFTVKEEEDFLKEYISFTITPVTLADGELGDPVNRLGSYFSQLAFSGTGLLQDQYTLHQITITISEDLGNAFNYDTLTEDAFDFDVTLIAWQSLYVDSKPELPVNPE